MKKFIAFTGVCLFAYGVWGQEKAAGRPALTVFKEGNNMKKLIALAGVCLIVCGV